MTTYKLIRTVHYARTGGRLRRVRVVTQVLDRTPGGPCLAPVNLPITVKGGETRLVPVACGRRLRPDEQCENCRVEIEVVEVRRVVHPAPAASPAPRAVALGGAA
jgi:hypothetical protein